ncbi:10045_t:CDS:1, partial [Paraglomus occultum]
MPQPYETKPLPTLFLIVIFALELGVAFLQAAFIVLEHILPGFDKKNTPRKELLLSRLCSNDELKNHYVPKRCE